MRPRPASLAGVTADGLARVRHGAQEFHRRPMPVGLRTDANLTEHCSRLRSERRRGRDGGCVAVVGEALAGTGAPSQDPVARAGFERVAVGASKRAGEGGDAGRFPRRNPGGARRSLAGRRDRVCRRTARRRTRSIRVLEPPACLRSRSPVAKGERTSPTDRRRNSTAATRRPSQYDHRKPPPAPQDRRRGKMVGVRHVPRRVPPFAMFADAPGDYG